MASANDTFNFKLEELEYWKIAKQTVSSYILIGVNRSLSI